MTTSLKNITKETQWVRLGLVLALLLFLLYGFFSEKIPVNGGCGWDGAAYANITEKIDKYLEWHSINKYYLQRTLVPFLLHYSLKLLDIPLSYPNIIAAFGGLNIYCVILGAFFFFKISDILRLSSAMEIIGFSMLFFCFPVLKLTGYYPVIMDIPAFFIGILLVYFYLKNNISLFFLFIFLGSFVFPNFIIFSVLFFFKKESLTDNELPAQKTESTLWRTLISATLPTIFIAMILYFWVIKKGGIIQIGGLDINLKSLNFFVSFIFAAVYLVILNYSTGFSVTIKQLFQLVNRQGVAFGITVFFCLQIVLRVFSAAGDAALTFHDYLYNIFFSAVRNPLNFYVAHVFYYGVAFLLLFFVLNDFKAEIKRHGLGMVLFFNLFFFFSVGSESRQLINYYPFFVIILMTVLNRSWKISPTVAVAVVLVNLALSHVWYKIDSSFPSGAYIPAEFLTFPEQSYFQFQGPWVSDTMYQVHSGVVLVLLAALFWVFRKSTLISPKKKTDK